MPLAWFDVLATLQRAGGSMRVGELCGELGRGAVEPQPPPRPPRTGRLGAAPPGAEPGGRACRSRCRSRRRVARCWRDANVTYRRMVQQVFASKLTDTDIAAITRVLGKVNTE